MLRYYKQTLIQLFRSIQIIAASPQTSAQEVFAVQRVLIRRIIYIERKIQSLRTQIAQQKRALATHQSKEQSLRTCLVVQRGRA